MLRHVDLTVELFRIYLRDDSQKAHVAAVNAITKDFDAVSGAFFYVDVAGSFRLCLAGTDFPIRLPEDRWRACLIDDDAADPGSRRDWSPPGLDVPVAFWVYAPFHISGSEDGYVFLGRNDGPWDVDEKKAFIAIMAVVSELVETRREKEFEALSRIEAENALARHERRMTAFFDSSRDMIYTTDAAHRFTSINHAGLDLFGLSSRNEIIGHSFSEFMTDASIPEFFTKKLETDGYIDDYEIVLRRGDGTSLFCLETAHVVKAPDGSIIEIQGLIKDISDRIRNERELWKMNLELSEMNLKLKQAQSLMIQHEKLASIGQLAAGVAHEINNPLGFLKSNHRMIGKYVETMRSALGECKLLDPRLFDQLSAKYDLEYTLDEATSIFAESDDGFARIMKIVSNLMSFSRMEQKSDFEIYDINAGIESTLVVAWNELKYVAEVRKFLGELPPIFAMGGEINQVILNILVNAAQAIASQKRAEKGLISIATKISGPYAVILVSDDGPGIPDEVRSRIFDPFFTTKEPGKGTGLGLSISYDIVVSKHRGRLSVESEIGKGSTFKIELPIAPMDT